MSGRRPPSELIMGQLNFDPRDPKGNEIRLRSLHAMLVAHPTNHTTTPARLAEGLQKQAGMDLTKK